MGTSLRCVLALVVAVALPLSAVAQEQTDATATSAAQTAAAEEEWLKTVWSQIDSLVVEQDFELQQTVVTGGVRGVEAQDMLLDHYYFKGGKRYSSQQTLARIIAQLERQLRARRRPVDRAKLRYLTAICSDMVGEYDTARQYYEAVLAHHEDSSYARRSRQRLDQLSSSNR
jgi:hypothetical protein